MLAIVVELLLVVLSIAEKREEGLLGRNSMKVEGSFMYYVLCTRY